MTLDELHAALDQAERDLFDHAESCPVCTAFTHTPTYAQLRQCPEFRRLDNHNTDLGQEHYERTTKKGRICLCELQS